MKLLDRYSVLILDLNGVFMFGEDRFGPDEDFHPAYRQSGGARLTAAEVNHAIRACFEGVMRDYHAPERFDAFPSLRDSLRHYSAATDDDLDHLEATFALHERGSIPPAHSTFLLKLAETHPLGLVSNLWARKGPWLSEFRQAGIYDLFRTKVFSSDFRSVKPSPALFRQALQAFPATPPARILFIGDSLARDIIPAKRLGLATAWITTGDASSPEADHVLPSLLALADA